MYQILIRPVHGGAYACGKTECSIHYKYGEPRKRDQREPRDQWLALTSNAHEGYVDWDVFEAIQRMVHANARLAGRAGAPKSGEALLSASK